MQMALANETQREIQEEHEKPCETCEGIAEAMSTTTDVLYGLNMSVLLRTRPTILLILARLPCL